jgi:hypothetical protein
MIRFKPEVSFINVQWRTLQAMVITEEIYDEEDAVLVITSLTDGQHGDGGPAQPGKADHTLHDDGLAFDARTRQLSLNTVTSIHGKMLQRLPKGWQVIVEADHIHAEWDPQP